MKRPNTISKETWACMTKKERKFKLAALQRQFMENMRAAAAKVAPIVAPAGIGKSMLVLDDSFEPAPAWIKNLIAEPLYNRRIK